MASPDSFGGYEEDRFENKVDIKLQCSVCLKVFKDIYLLMKDQDVKNHRYRKN